ncbi:MAG: restriction endonuclease subunit S, partial [Methanosphaera sp.]|nr:restriction endonuclease subunit S [Methanosphaera sp.]
LCIFIEKKYNSLISYKKYLLNTLYPDSRANTSYLNSANNNISWNFKPLKDIGTITTGVTPKGTKNEVFDENGLLWITANDLSNDKYITDTKRRLNASLVKKSKIIKEGSIFVSCIGIIGKIAINKEVCSCNQQINAITPYDEYDSEYIYYTLQRYKNLLNSHASQSVTLLLKKSEFSV